MQTSTPEGRGAGADPASRAQEGFTVTAIPAAGWLLTLLSEPLGGGLHCTFGTGERVESEH